jgi:hypothetical protein
MRERFRRTSHKIFVALFAKPLREKSRTKLDGYQGGWSGIGHKPRFAIIEQFAIFCNMMFSWSAVNDSAAKLRQIFSPATLLRVESESERRQQGRVYLW